MIDTRAPIEVGYPSILKFSMTQCAACGVELQTPEWDFQDGLDPICVDCCQEMFSPPITFTCQICLADDCPIEEMQTIDTFDAQCNHIFCLECLTKYISIELQTNRSPKNLKFNCPG